ncbi:hypothetical protein HHL17_26980 [Chitinophaga sp. G-6-1-13]|uniref:3-hydroxyacyl-CoA dehydrogenase n=1 Tax=Chitinophaga fulva TaxID=2728842 RepID=A0A848GVZ8_9BACT|nr:hypothetical protein [Chitinophaga fulva]NML40870.1 hypothetical protein [Chitinophaga fulva]
MNKSLITLQISPAAIVEFPLYDAPPRTIFTITDAIPYGIWFDKTSRLLYWTNMGKQTDQHEGFAAKDGSIQCCDLNGEQHRILIGNGAITTPQQLTGDPERGFLYWCDREGMAVMRCHMDGSGLETLVRQGQSEQDRLEGEKQCVGISLDTLRQHIYWTQEGPAKGGKGRIFRAGINIPEGQTADNRTDITLLIDQLPEPIYLEFAEISGRLYWTDRGAPPNGNSLNSATITEDGRLLNHHLLITGLQEGIGLTVDEKDNKAYVTDLGGYIREVNLATGRQSILRQQGATTGITLLTDS